MRTWNLFLSSLLLAGFLSGFVCAGENTASDKRIGNLSLPDVRTGRPVALADFQDRKAIVVLFLGTECPVNNAYLPRLVELHKEYAAKGVQFLAINSLKTDKLEQGAEQAKKNAIPFSWRK